MKQKDTPKGVWAVLDAKIEARKAKERMWRNFLVTAAVLVLLLLVGAGLFSWLVALG